MRGMSIRKALRAVPYIAGAALFGWALIVLSWLPCAVTG